MGVKIMNPIIVNKKSWHYRLATVYGPLSDCDGVDSCRYIRAVIVGLFVMLVIGILSCLFLILPVDSLVWVIASIIGGGFVGQPHFFAVFLGVMISAIAFLIGWNIIWIRQKIIDRRYARSLMHVEPSTISKLYGSFKNKFCVPIEVK